MRVAFVPRSAEIQPLFWRFVFHMSLDFYLDTMILYIYIYYDDERHISLSLYISLYIIIRITRVCVLCLL